MANLVQLKQKDIKILKEKIWLSNNKRCPLLQIEVELDKMTLDHIHKLKAEIPSEQKGTIRNAIEFRANVLEGKISNAWKRYFGSDESKHPITLANYLRNLADYLENGAYCETVENDDTFFIHPKEKIPELILKKSSYNELKKVATVKIPEYKNKQKYTVAMKKLFDKYQIEPSFY